jgi:hypothetical protein
VMAGNKADLASESHEVFIEDVKEGLEEDYGENN